MYNTKPNPIVISNELIYFRKLNYLPFENKLFSYLLFKKQVNSTCNVDIIKF